MLNPNKIENKIVLSVLHKYPQEIQQNLMNIRSLIIETAQEDAEIGTIEETLKWGEISYLTAKGSTIRLAWKASMPNQYGVYFNCKTKLVDTFKEIYRDTFKYETNRAIILSNKQEIPVKPLKHCLQLALTYHNIKHLPLLGA
ncbi:MAG: DUF1801 domain-containing protein [Cocleimonas sp.]